MGTVYRSGRHVRSAVAKMPLRVQRLLVSVFDKWKWEAEDASMVCAQQGHDAQYCHCN